MRMDQPVDEYPNDANPIKFAPPPPNGEGGPQYPIDPNPIKPGGDLPPQYPIDPNGGKLLSDVQNPMDANKKPMKPWSAAMLGSTY